MYEIKINTTPKTNFSRIAMTARKRGIKGDIIIISVNDPGRCWILREGKFSVEAYG